LAASIENARLVSESRAAIDQLEKLGSEGTRKVWSQYLRASSFAYQFTPAGTRSITSVPESGQPRGTRIPLMLRGQEIGSIAVQRSTGEHWTPTEQDLMEKLAAQIALALENARLIEETRQRATQEQVVSEISARFSRSLEVEALLQAAVREFAALPDVAEAAVVLKPVAGQES
jgi:K+-sensing histidine kinase KdpD